MSGRLKSMVKRVIVWLLTQSDVILNSSPCSHITLSNLVIVGNVHTAVCNWQRADESDSDSDDDIYSDVYEVLSSNYNKVMLMPDNQLQTSHTHVQASSTPSTVERRPKPTVATSSRSRMSIIFGDQCNIQRPSVTSSRRGPTVKKYSIDNFNFLKVLGKGSFGKVRVCLFQWALFHLTVFDAYC